MRQVGHGGTSSPRCPTNGGRGRRPRRPRAGVRIAAGAAALAALVLLPARSGVAYRFDSFYTVGPATPSTASAVRWDEADLPIVFRIADNDLARRASLDAVRAVIEEAFAAWNRVPTSRIRVELGDDPIPAGEFGAQGINEIVLTADSGRGGSAGIRRYDSESIRECDIGLNAGRYSHPRSQGVRADLKYLVMHELGHCLGLQHSEMYPMSDWVEGVPSAYYPPPLMSYSWTREPLLAEDDRIGVSLLYPAEGFLRSRGSVAGRIVTARGLPARFAYVQAIVVGPRPGAGPGAFTNENGYFVLEGLPPGPVLLWVHPVLWWIGDPHNSLGTPSPSGGPAAIRDQWRWATVTPGETSVVPTIVAPTGRLVLRR